MPDPIYTFTESQIATIQSLIGRVDRSSRYMYHRYGRPSGRLGLNLGPVLNPLSASRTQRGAYTPVYEYIHSILDPLVQNNESDIGRMNFWFEQAAGINMNAGPAAEWIRTFTERGMINASNYDNDPSNDITSIPVSEMNAISNSIGGAVIRSIVKDGNNGNLLSLSHILAEDISNALNGVDQFNNPTLTPIANLGGWGGSFFFWDQPYLLSDTNAPTGQVDWTIGDQILSDPDAKRLFIDTTGDALAHRARWGNLWL